MVRYFAPFDGNFWVGFVQPNLFRAIKRNFARFFTIPLKSFECCHDFSPPFLPTTLFGLMFTIEPGLPGTEPFTTSKFF